MEWGTDVFPAVKPAAKSARRPDDGSHGATVYREPGLRFMINRLSRPSAGDAEVPGATTGPLGLLPEFRGDPLGLLRRVAAIGDVVLLPMGSPQFFVRTYMVSSPRGVEQVLATKGKVYRKSFTNLPARSIFGLGLLTSDGRSWVEQRRILRPVFQRDRIDRLASAVTKTCDELIDRWRAAARAQKVVDLGAEMASLSLQILLRSTFGRELSIAVMNEIAAVFPVLSQQSWRRTVSLSWWCFPRLASGIPTPSNVGFRRAQRRLDTIVRDLSAANSPGDDGSLLSVLKASENNGRPLSDELIRDEIVTFLIAGHETTASSLTWALYLLARNPEVWDRLHAEVSAIGSESRLARAVVMESLRMYPPAWSIVRDAAQDDDIDGVRIPAGSVIITSPYATQRDPRFWERPDEFCPERFEQGPGKTAWDPRVYFPFGAGMRHCVGEHMAMRQAVDVVARIAGSFRPVLCDEAPVDPVPAVTLRQSRKVLAWLREV